MKKMLVVIGLLLVPYLLFQIAYRYYGNGHNYQYTVTNASSQFNIDEHFTNDKDNPNYYFKIQTDNNIFYLQTYEKFNNKGKIIENIYYFSDEHYQCILPIFSGNKIIMDMLCKSTNDYFYYYNYLKGLNENLDLFATSLETVGYDVNQWNTLVEGYEKDNFKFYYNNMYLNNYLLLTDYKGITLFNSKTKKINKINLFSKDVYKQKIDFVYKNKYVVADYNSQYRFHEFYVIDIISGEKSTIVSEQELSFDTYVQGIVDDKVYFFDRNSKKQYEIDMENKTVKEVGNNQKGVKIYDFFTKEWTLTSAITASNELLIFNQLEIDEVEDFNKVYKMGTDSFGYYFYYKKIEDKYLVYRANIQDNNQLTYIFTTNNIDNIIYFYNSIYYIDGETINNYSDKYGIRKIISYDELKFNKNLYFSVYSK